MRVVYKDKTLVINEELDEIVGNIEPLNHGGYWVTVGTIGTAIGVAVDHTEWNAFVDLVKEIDEAVKEDYCDQNRI